MSRYNSLDNIEVKKCTKCNNIYRVYDDSEYLRVTDNELKFLLNAGNSIRLKGKCPHCKGTGNDVKIHTYFFCTTRGHRVNIELCELRREQKSYGCMSCKIYKLKTHNTDHENKKIYKVKVDEHKEVISEEKELTNNVDEKDKKRKYNKKSNKDKKINKNSKIKKDVIKKEIDKSNVKRGRGRPKGSKNKNKV